MQASNNPARLALMATAVLAASPLAHAHQAAAATTTDAVHYDAAPANPDASVDGSGRGGWYSATVNGVTGKLRVYASNAFPTWNEGLNRKWARRFVALPHGKELSQLTVFLSPYNEVSLDDVCGTDADSCYDSDTNMMYLAVDQPESDPYQVAMHEYGHHLATFLGTNEWEAVDMGPRHWAAAADVRALTKQHRLWPGDQDEHWFENPGEIWAETYRVVASNFVGVRPDPWDSVEDTWNPAKRPALMAAALLDTSPKLTSAARLIDPFVAQWPQAIKQPGA
jgi:hypothetical protein